VLQPEALESAAVAALAQAAAGAVRTARAEPRVLTAAELEARDVPEPGFVIENLLTGPGAWALIGSHKAGKTVFAAQLALSYQAGVPFLDYYRMLESRPALFIEQDDPLRELALRDILRRTPIADRRGFFAVERPSFTLGAELLAYLERQIVTRGLGFVALDSYTKMRGYREGGADVVKIESREFGLLDELAKKLNCVILILHHRSHGNASADWQDQAAGTYAVGAACEGQVYISRFADLPVNSPERLVRVRGRRLEGTELVIRFRRETLDYEFVMDGAACEMYPAIQQLRAAFGTRAFTPKDLYHEAGVARATAHRLLARLLAAGVAYRAGYGQYTLRPE
jgi:hypothetical protein